MDVASVTPALQLMLTKDNMVTEYQDVQIEQTRILI